MKRIDPYQFLSVVLGIAILISIVLFIYNLSTGTFGKAALRVDTVYGKSAVVVNGKDSGETPFYNEQGKSGDLEIKINGEKNSYTTIIKPAAGTTAALKRDLGVSDIFSSGQNVWFTKIGGKDSAVNVLSRDVDEVSVIVDGVEVGKTPVRFLTKSLLNQNQENKYSLVFKKDGY